MTKNLQRVKKSDLKVIVEKNNQLIEALRNLKSKICCEDSDELPVSEGDRQRDVLNPS